MGQYTVEEDDFKAIPEDTFVSAKLMEMNNKSFPYTDKKTREEKIAEKVEWWFQITDGEHEGRRIKGETWAQITSNPNNKFRSWVEALLQREITPGFTFTDDDLIGLPCSLTVKHVVGGKDNDRIYENVDEVIPATTSFEPAF
jgi:hypothetical protein